MSAWPRPPLPPPPQPSAGFTAAAFEAALAFSAGAPAWWLERKREAYARFAALPMPTRKDEAWRFSNLGGVTLDGFAPAPAPAGPAPTPAERRILAARLARVRRQPAGALAAAAGRT